MTGQMPRSRAASRLALAIIALVGDGGTMRARRDPPERLRIATVARLAAGQNGTRSVPSGSRLVVDLFGS